MQKQTALTRNVLPEILKQKVNMRSKGWALPGKLGVFRYLSWYQTKPASNVQRQIMHSYSNKIHVRNKAWKQINPVPQQGRKAKPSKQEANVLPWLAGWLAATFLKLSKF
jgi:hypothetical protein